MKVVDLLILYNFYFGQISCSHMKIGVSTVQTRAKIIQTSKQCSSCSSLCPDAHTAAVVAGERVHASAIAPDLGVGALILVDASKLPVPFPILLPRS